MSGAAIAMMIVAILIIWGGLVFALVNLSRHPEEPEDDAVERQPPNNAVYARGQVCGLCPVRRNIEYSRTRRE